MGFNGTFNNISVISWQGQLFFRADSSLGAKQEGLKIVHFLNKLIVSCKEAVRFLSKFFWLFLNWIVILNEHERLSNINFDTSYRNSL
jgi:hypothetical protein